jgi:CHAD domain-containing protein
MKNFLGKAMDSYLKEMEKHARKISRGFDVEEIHHFRTATKKLRSLLRLQDVGKKVFPKRFMDSYHFSGDLRNAQLLLISLNESTTRLPNFLLWLATYIGEREQGWKKNYSDKLIPRLKQSLNNKKLPPLKVKHLQGFFDSHIARVEKIIHNPAPSDDALHDIRKLMKDLLYLRQWSKKYWPEGWAGTKKFTLSRLKKLADVAGSYNDLRTGQDLLAEYLEQETDPKAIKAAILFQKKQAKQSVDNKQDLVTALQKFSGKFSPAPRKKTKLLKAGV